MMNEKRFEELWQSAEAVLHAERLSAEYPAWRTSRRRTAGIVTSMALAVAIAVPLSVHNTSEHIYCNNPAVNSTHWIETADALLMEA